MNFKKLFLIALLTQPFYASAMFAFGLPGPSDEFADEFLPQKGVTLHGATCRIARLYNKDKVQYGDAWDMVFDMQQTFGCKFTTVYAAMRKAIKTKQVPEINEYHLLYIVAAHANAHGENILLPVHPYNTPSL
jgi:hypothetical protein